MELSDAVMFDLDGTLVRSEHAHRVAWQALFEHWAVEVDEAEYARMFMGRRARDVLGEVPGPWTGTDPETSLDVLRDHSRHAIAAVEAVPGAAGRVAALAAAGTPVAVVTSAGAEWAEQVLADVLGVRHHLSVLVTAERVTQGKPSPEGYLLACAELGVAPGRCTGVEDSPAGIAALVAAGVGTIVGLTTSSQAGTLRAAGAHTTAPDLTSQPV
ncbi:MAG: HAD family phosphatase [Pseudonocardia sp.]|uniref:HAD family hydrolase n=1 Tax=Pseudonocardia sp. TaxID=60912 RepID=UPI001AD1E892|nr:HAD family phosphatase [Pseudonocardia sp.]MBN9097340.1 HAD family phosphatase [Pseudonocardia sp.]